MIKNPSMEVYTKNDVITTVVTKDGVFKRKRIISLGGSIEIDIWYNTEGKYHREGDLPAIIDYKGGKIAYQYWFKDGKPRRDIGPVSIGTVNGVVKNYWYINGFKVDYLNVPEGKRLSPEFRQTIHHLPLPIGQAIAHHFIEIWQFVDAD